MQDKKHINVYMYAFFLVSQSLPVFSTKSATLIQVTKLHIVKNITYPCKKNNKDDKRYSRQKKKVIEIVTTTALFAQTKSFQSGPYEGAEQHKTETVRPGLGTSSLKATHSYQINRGERRRIEEQKGVWAGALEMGKGGRPMGASAHAPIPEADVGRLGDGEDYHRKINPGTQVILWL